LAARLWIDVEDLFEYARANGRPSGIQRLAFEIYQIMQDRYGETGFVKFVRHDRGGFRVVQWHEVSGLFQKLSAQQAAPTVGMGHPILPHPPGWQLVRKLVHRLWPSLRHTVRDVVRAQGEAFRAWGRLAAALWQGARRRVLNLAVRLRKLNDRSGNTETTGPTGDSFAKCSTRGDIILVLGAPWSHPDYAGFVRVQRERGLRFALLVYDLVPILRPEWCERGLVRLFRAWFRDVLPLCDVVLAISRATAADVEAYARENGIVLPGPVKPVPVGTGFSGQLQLPATSRRHALPPAASYALFVSTIEARKNHTLLFRVWRRLLDDLPSEQVPTLVFAGRIGWLVDDLMRQIANTDHLNGKLVVIENPTDADLATLYRGCLFTLLPSFHEGWGLPVTESLAFGKPCIISDRTSLPEAGGRFVRSFDPDNLHDAYHVIRQVIEDRPGLAEWEAQVRREFKPVPWSATVEAILTELGYPLEVPTMHVVQSIRESHECSS
jgi:glycosyltransferase involved in cell wall biosynthesis